MSDHVPEPGRGVKRPHEESSLDVVPLRTGQWTVAEMAFANKVIEYFDKGSLPNCTNGTTLRALLADILHCSPMRISKKYAGDGAIGKRTFTKLSVCRVCLRCTTLFPGHRQSAARPIFSGVLVFGRNATALAGGAESAGTRVSRIAPGPCAMATGQWRVPPAPSCAQVEWKTLLLGRTGSGSPRIPPPQPRPRPQIPEATPPLLSAPRPPQLLQPPPLPVPPQPRGSTPAPRKRNLCRTARDGFRSAARGAVLAPRAQRALPANFVRTYLEDSIADLARAGWAD